MKIFAVTRNYGIPTPASPFGEGERPVWYEIPDSSILRSGQPFFIPDFSTAFRAFPSIAIRIGRLGKGIAERFAGRYIAETGIACAVVAVPLLADLRKEGLPWAGATAFDKCCWLGKFLNDSLKDGVFTIESGSLSIQYNVTNLRHGVEAIISMLSRDITLKEGDIILAGLHPEGIAITHPSSLTIKNQSDNTPFLDIHLR